jgi:hypothetical protein
MTQNSSEKIGFTPGPYTIEDRLMQGVDILAVVEGWGKNPVRVANVVPFKNAVQTASLLAASTDMYEALQPPFVRLAEKVKELRHEPGSTCEWRISYDDLVRAAEAVAKAVKL